jgi:curved DNA-binding protein CbpA
VKDYYKILEIEFGADLMSIKKSYRRLALKYHPDKNHASDTAQKFIEITEAYVILRDPLKKHDYDNIYQAYYKKNSESKASKPDYRTSYENKQREWSQYGKEKAKEYSSIPFDEFARRLLKEISVGSNYIPNIIAIFFTGGGAIGILTILPKSFEGKNGFGFFMLLMALVFGYVSYRLYLVARADYKEERKRKILNNL